MLQLSSSAAARLAGARAARGLSEEFALRVHAERRNGLRGISLQFAREPFDGDAVGVSEGLRVFVASDLTEELEHQIIELDETEEQGFVYRLRAQRGEQA